MNKFVREKPTGKMERLRQAVYIPYLRRSHPRYARFSASRVTNPLHERFTTHVNKARECLENLNQKRREGRTVGFLEDAYYNRPWFATLVGHLEVMVTRVTTLRGRQMDEADFKRYTVCLANLEIVTSLIIFCDSDYYRTISDKDIEEFRFPLSKWSRAVITGLKIDGDRVYIATPVL